MQAPFFWNGNTGQTLTPGQAKVLREMAAQKVASQGTPSNLGEGLASVGLPVPPMPAGLREVCRGRDGAHTAMGDAWRLLHVMTTVYWPAVAEWKKIGARRL